MPLWVFFIFQQIQIVGLHGTHYIKTLFSIFAVKTNCSRNTYTYEWKATKYEPWSNKIKFVQIKNKRGSGSGFQSLTTGQETFTHWYEGLWQYYSTLPCLCAHASWPYKPTTGALGIVCWLLAKLLPGLSPRQRGAKKARYLRLINTNVHWF